MTLLATTICPSNHHIQSIHILYYHIYTTDFGKNSYIIKGDRDNNKGVLQKENRFQTFR
jgi:predicted nucleotidyltransferase component of viral defense system